MSGANTTVLLMWKVSVWEAGGGFREWPFIAVGRVLLVSGANMTVMRLWKVDVRVSWEFRDPVVGLSSSLVLNGWFRAVCSRGFLQPWGVIWAPWPT